jgi:hypothetical protein
MWRAFQSLKIARASIRHHLTWSRVADADHNVRAEQKIVEPPGRFAPAIPNPVLYYKNGLCATIWHKGKDGANSMYEIAFLNPHDAREGWHFEGALSWALFELVDVLDRDDTMLQFAQSATRPELQNREALRLVSPTGAVLLGPIKRRSAESNLAAFCEHTLLRMLRSM